MRTRAAVAIGAFVVASASLASQQITSQVLTERAAAYMAEQFPRLSNVVAEEQYLQQTTSPNRKRTLRSDYLIVRLQDSGDFASFRDVFEVDARPVRDRDERLQKLFLSGTPGSAIQQAQNIARESSRHNIWDIGTINNPYLAMAFIQDAYRSRFRLQSPRQERALGPDVWAMVYQEFRTPTILKGNGNRDIMTRGRWFIEASTGRVVGTEMRMGTGLAEIRIEVDFRYDENLKLNMPAEMREWYPDGRVGEIRGVATYGRFRRFGVSTSEQVVP